MPEMPPSKCAVEFLDLISEQQMEQKDYSNIEQVCSRCAVRGWLNEGVTEFQGRCSIIDPSNGPFPVLAQLVQRGV